MDNDNQIVLYHPELVSADRPGQRGMALMRDGMFLAVILDHEVCGDKPRTSIAMQPGMLAQAFAVGQATSPQASVSVDQHAVTWTRASDGFAIRVALEDGPMNRLRAWATQSVAA